MQGVRKASHWPPQSITINSSTWGCKRQDLLPLQHLGVPGVPGMMSAHDMQHWHHADDPWVHQVSLRPRRVMLRHGRALLLGVGVTLHNLGTLARGAWGPLHPPSAHWVSRWVHDHV